MIGKTKFSLFVVLVACLIKNNDAKKQRLEFRGNKDVKTNRPIIGKKENRRQLIQLLLYLYFSVWLFIFVLLVLK